jgi:hypothetical protein
MRREVELEHIFEETAIDHKLRQEIIEVSSAYGDGSELRESICAWGEQIGLRNTYKRESEIVTFLPKEFNLKQMANAKFMDLPNMEHALRRSRRTSNLVVRGTFNRSIAVHREDLVFFAPRGEMWTDAIINNAIESERGRCTAIQIASPLIHEAWSGFDFLFTIQVDPRPLFEHGLGDIYLHKARGLLNDAVFSVIINVDRQVVSYRDPIYTVIRSASPRDGKHLGRRKDGSLDLLKTEYPPEVWEPLIEDLTQVVWKRVEQVFDLREEAEMLRERLMSQQYATHAVRQWLIGHGLPVEDIDEERSRQVAVALAVGVAHPLIRLESVGFWKVIPANA